MQTFCEIYFAVAASVSSWWMIPLVMPATIKLLILKNVNCVICVFIRKIVMKYNLRGPSRPSPLSVNITSHVSQWITACGYGDGSKQSILWPCHPFTISHSFSRHLLVCPGWRLMTSCFTGTATMRWRGWGRRARARTRAAATSSVTCAPCTQTTAQRARWPRSGRGHTHGRTWEDLRQREEQRLQERSVRRCITTEEKR